MQIISSCSTWDLCPSVTQHSRFLDVSGSKINRLLIFKFECFSETSSWFLVINILLQLTENLINWSQKQDLSFQGRGIPWKLTIGSGFATWWFQDQLSLVFWFCFCISSMYTFLFWLFSLKSQDGVYSFRHRELFSVCLRLQVPMPEALAGRPSKLKVRVCIRERFNRAMEGDGWLMAPKPQTPQRVLAIYF